MFYIFLFNTQTFISKTHFVRYSKNFRPQSSFPLPKRITAKYLRYLRKWFSWKSMQDILTLKTLGSGRGGVNLTPPPMLFFRKCIFYSAVKPCFFVTINIIISHITVGNFIEIPQVVQKIWRFSQSILTNFYRFLGSFWRCLVTKKQIISI